MEKLAEKLFPQINGLNEQIDPLLIELETKNREKLQEQV